MLVPKFRRALPAVCVAALALPAAAQAAPPVGSVTEFPATNPDSANGALVVGADHNLWFTRFTDSRIVRMTTTGTVTEFPLADPMADPSGITAGPDGNLWFSEFGANKIGRITTSGTITEFTIPTASSYPGPIVEGPDGALWFTEYATGKIGRITTTGVVTEFSLSSPSAEPYGIVAGPDDALWFTEWGANQIGRLDTSGTLTEYALPTAGAEPLGIVVGADDNLWFTEQTGGRVGRITPNGVVTEFPVGGTTPWSLTTGVDGNVWFTYGDRPAVGRIAPDGTTTDFPVPHGATGMIARGPDDALWIGESGADMIARMYIGGPEATFDTTAPAFGSTELGSASSQTVTLTNTGTLDLDLSAPALAGDPAFGLTMTTCTSVLHANASCVLELRFAPGTAGMKTGTLSFAGTTLNLSGPGVYPAPDAQTGSASNPTVNGIANPHGAATSAWFEYGTSSAYGAATITHSLGDGTADVPVSATLGGLQAGTTYHYRLVSNSAGGTTYGADATFTTAAAPAPPPAPVHTTTPPAAFRVTLVSASITAKTVTLRVSCNRACSGTATVRKRSGVLGRAKYSIAAGRTLTVRVRAKTRGAHASIALAAHDRNGATATASHAV